MIKLGDQNIKDIYLGDQKIAKVYLGDQLIYPSSTVPYEIPTGINIAEVDDELPILVSATVQDATPMQIDLVFSQSITMSNDLAWVINGLVSSYFDTLTGSGTNWIGTLTEEVLEGQAIDLNYDQKIGDAENTVGNPMSSFTDYAVVNNVVDTPVNNSYYDFDRTTNAWMQSDLDLNGWQNQTWIFNAQVRMDAVELTFAGGTAEGLDLKRHSGGNIWGEFLEQATSQAWTYDTNWHQFGFIYNQSNNGIHLFVDGVSLGAPFRDTFGGFVSTMIPQIGRRGDSTSNSYKFFGYMKDIQIYNVALSVQDMADIAADITDTKAGLVANFAADKTSGIWTDDVGGYELVNQGGLTLIQE